MWNVKGSGSNFYWKFKVGKYNIILIFCEYLL